MSHHNRNSKKPLLVTSLNSFCYCRKYVGIVINFLTILYAVLSIVDDIKSCKKASKLSLCYFV